MKEVEELGEGTIHGREVGGECGQECICLSVKGKKGVDCWYWKSKDDGKGQDKINVLKYIKHINAVLFILMKCSYPSFRFKRS